MRNIFICLFFIGVIILLCNVFNNSYAYSYDIDNSILFYKDNYFELESDIKKYISNIDDYIIILFIIILPQYSLTLEHY